MEIIRIVLNYYYYIYIIYNQNAIYIPYKKYKKYAESMFTISLL